MKPLSYSVLSQFQRCPKLYELAQIRKLPEEGPPSGDMAFGSAMHCALQASLEGDDPYAGFANYWNAIKGKPYTYGRYDWGAYEGMGPAFIDKFQTYQYKHIVPVSVEERLAHQYVGVPFEGTPDVIGYYKGVLSVIDFKTSASRYDKSKIESNAQMPLYAWLSHQTLAQTPLQRVYIVFVKYDLSIQTLVAPLTSQEISASMENSWQWAIDIDTRKVFPKNTQGCVLGSYKCGYYNHCWKAYVKEKTDE